MSTLDIERVRELLGAGFAVEYHAAIGSTSDRALELARGGAAAGTLVCADVQTAGRGRRGAAWVAPAESSVLASLVLRTREPQPPHVLAIYSGVAAAEGLADVGVRARIKWPNDLMVGDRKVAGLLVETHEDAVVIGFGINCRVPAEAFPVEFRARAGSLDSAAGWDGAREDVLAAVARRLAAYIGDEAFCTLPHAVLRWNELNWFRRRRVRVSGPMGVVEGDGLFLDARKLHFHVFTPKGFTVMPLISTVEAL